jgi:hypothetical protein
VVDPGVTPLGAKPDYNSIIYYTKSCIEKPQTYKHPHYTTPNYSQRPIFELVSLIQLPILYDMLCVLVSVTTIFVPRLLPGEYHGLELLNGGVGKVGTQSNAQAAVYGRCNASCKNSSSLFLRVLPPPSSSCRFEESLLSRGGADECVCRR